MNTRTAFSFAFFAIMIILMAGFAQCGHAVTLKVSDEQYTIFRQTEKGWDRQVPIELNNSGDPISSGEFRVTVGSNTFDCPMELIPSGESHDILWIPGENIAMDINVQIVQNGGVIASQIMNLPMVAPDKVVAIPRSPIMKVEQLTPLCIRGTNYLARRYPWPGLYRQASVVTFEDDFALMRTFSINTIRTFVFYDADEQYGLYRKDGSATTKAQKGLADLLAVADRHHIKVILNAGALPPLEDIPAARRMYKTILSPFINDGRILMFDVMNEPGGSDGPKANKTLSTWLQTMYAYSRSILPNHMLTVGLCWQFDQLWDLGIKPDVAQYHDYSGAVGSQPVGKPPVRNISDDLARIKSFVGKRPLIIGEFGISTAAEVPRGVSEARQKEIYAGIFEGAEKQRITGVLNWTFYDFVPDWMGKFEQKFGIVRTDGSLKPAGVLLKQVYTRWAAQYPAQWDVRK